MKPVEVTSTMLRKDLTKLPLKGVTGGTAILGEVDPRSQIIETLVNLELCDVEEDGEVTCHFEVNTSRDQVFIAGALAWSKIADERCAMQVAEMTKASDTHWRQLQDCLMKQESAGLEREIRRKQRAHDKELRRRQQKFDRMTRKLRDLLPSAPGK